MIKLHTFDRLKQQASLR